jgi:hypothetical protein
VNTTAIVTAVNKLMTMLAIGRLVSCSGLGGNLTAYNIGLP